MAVRARPGWDEPVNVYTVTSLPPGSRKSPVFRAMMGPIVKFEQDISEKTRKDIADAEARRDIHDVGHGRRPEEEPAHRAHQQRICGTHASKLNGRARADK